ncbi:IclR family transcriptional regulator [Bacillus sp. M6-12]|uniref:IclR family transcriptional regulator n=1 Tax=Bacillus sp. M6-12 TaxID=2054166 RepID=UPI000C775571|nr:IclR family transcriptional regulator [Bacillus sp. M6-12]PLS18549.1 IclR family transcriptional regulator [Bacillus sp. M6-12]
MRELNMGSIRSIDRAIDILQSFTFERPFLTIEEMAKLTNLPNSTVYRILCTLERRALVQYDEKLLVYKPGLRLMEFGVLTSSVLDIRQESEEILYDLHIKTKQTVLMAVQEGDGIIYIYKRENLEGLKFSSFVGQRRPFMYGVLGPILLAYSTKEQIDSILSKPLTQHTKHTITEPETVRARLEEIRQEKIHIDASETFLGVTGVGSPIFGLNQEVIAAIGVIGPSVHMDEQVDKVKKLIFEAAQTISFKMGYRT